MKNLIRLLTVLVGVGLPAAAPVGAEPMPEPQVSYAADYVLETSGMQMKGKVFAAPGMERREQLAGSEKSILIVRRDKGVIWNVMLSEGMYMETPLRGNSGPGADVSIREKSVVGEEQVNGLQATKYKVVFDQNESVFDGFMWLTKEGITVKMDAVARKQASRMRLRQELSNVRIERQNAALFEIPAGYHKMGMLGMGAMMDDMAEGEADLEPGATEEEAGDLADMMKGVKGLFGR